MGEGSVAAQGAAAGQLTEHKLSLWVTLGGALQFPGVPGKLQNG